MELAKGFKQTEVGMIPCDWEISSLRGISTHISDGTHYTPKYVSSGVPFYSVENITANDFVNTKFITPEEHQQLIKRCKPERGDILMTRITAGILGDTKLIDWDVDASIYVSLALIKLKKNLNSEYIYRYTKSPAFRREVEKRGLVNATPKKINMNEIGAVPVPLPSSQKEQEAIGNALSDAYDYIESLERLISKKRLIKMGMMQELLTGKRRLKGFANRWEEKTINEIADILDHLRIPLNESQRLTMPGDYPYCGANGVLDYINQYCVNDTVILIAEDGGYFDEYATRPIAYRMSGKFWVNNHAHILKSKKGFDQDFLFYSLVHKNILTFLASGTRAKLNKSELQKITILCPPTVKEQQAISGCLNDMDNEMTVIEQKLQKARLIKEGMMQELLTGRIRLV